MNELTPFLEAAVRTATPLLLAAIGESIAERAGVINLGLEGCLIAGAFAASAGKPPSQPRPKKPLSTRYHGRMRKAAMPSASTIVSRRLLLSMSSLDRSKVPGRGERCGPA